jgi:hypothetical protein
MIFCVTSLGSYGCTFLDWSIHYLAGRDKFFNTSLGWIDLSRNPIQTTNAHGHQKNHPAGYKCTKIVVESLEQQANELTSLYPYSIELSAILAELNISLDQLRTYKDEVTQFGKDDSRKIWKLCDEKNIPLIFLDCQDRMYTWNLRGQGNTKHQDLMDYFFPNQYHTTDTIWDQRETLALRMEQLHMGRFYTDGSDAPCDFTQQHLWIKAEEFWFNDQVIHHVMNYLNLPIDPARLLLWTPIYYNWSRMQAQIMKFSWALDHICDCIVNNYYLDLRPYKLTLIQEAIIQHVMIYKYNLNFKIWNLEQFPDNTKDLHQLLEPNAHDIKDIHIAL